QTANAAHVEDLGTDDPFPTPTLTDEGWGAAWPCGSTPTPTPIPPPPLVGDNAGAPAPAQNIPSRTTAGLTATFQLCGTPDSQIQQSIENLIAGRGFSARLVSRSDGCADLTITVSPGSTSEQTGARQSTNLSVSSGSGGMVHTISVQIVSENGTTHVTIGPGS
ncbi:MAG TPA: hypothetical protein VKX96_03150, partial [Chloroflexota bacterium]|nr:hypothetical protein [Chloroflexota bacterium]